MPHTAAHDTFCRVGVVYSNCIVCGGPELLSLERYHAAHLVRCGTCDLVFSGRRPDDAELAEHYRDYGLAWFDSEITRQRYRELLDSLEPYRKTNRILDMGCGAGYFLDEAAKRGWEAYGSEFGELPLELSRGRGFTVVPAPLTPASFPADHFDVITSFEVVEHVRDPRAEAETLARLLRPGGLFYCTTPNFDALTRRLLGPRWRVIEYPEHLIYFTAQTLTSWLTGFGFVQPQVASTGLSPDEILRVAKQRRGSPDAGAEPAVASADPATDANADEPGGFDQRLRRLLDGQPALERSKAGINQALTRFGAGDTLKGRFVLGAPSGR
jgi:SAM-dependent methyltransferase